MTLPDLDPSNIGHMAFYQNQNIDYTNAKSFLDQYEEYSNGIDGLKSYFIEYGSYSNTMEVRMRVKDDGWVITYIPAVEQNPEGQFGSGSNLTGTFTLDSGNQMGSITVPNESGTYDNKGILATPISEFEDNDGRTVYLEDIGFYSYLYQDATNLSFMSVYTERAPFSYTYSSGTVVDRQEVVINYVEDGSLEITYDGNLIGSTSVLGAFSIPNNYGVDKAVTFDDTSISRDVTFAGSFLWH